jgi:uroporphyrinogen-III decarboxylase
MEIIEMPYNWNASIIRILKALAGTKRIDRVPYLPLAGEDTIARISGKTTRELLSSPELYAKATISSYEFLQSDVVSIPTAYTGPAEALAFAEVNGKADAISWYDYKIFMIQQGAVCKTKSDIENLIIPEHRKSKLWVNLFEAAKIIQQEISYPQNCILGLWCVVQELRGIQAYRDMRRDPELLMKLCEKIYESLLDVYYYSIDILGKPNFITIAGYSFNSHMMSFEDAMKYEGDFIKRLQREIKIPFILHNCGTAPYFEEVCKEIDFIGINGSHPLDINYWIEFQKKFPKVAILGANIDVSREILNGTPQVVEEKVKENILNLAHSGRYICSPVCSIPWGVSLTNIMAIPRAIEKYGKEPFKLKKNQ